MKKDFSIILKNAGLKVTPARGHILEAFSLHCGPVNAEEIHTKIKREDINLVTVYRTLATLETAGILKRVDLRKGSAYYELAEHHHHHIVCTDCGTIEGFDGCDIIDISKRALKNSSKFTFVHQHSLELYGLCKNCS